MLRKYFDDCHSKGVYLLIEEDSHYFTINFNKYDASDDCFPPHDKEIEKYYPSPSRTTSENYPKQRRPRDQEKKKEESLGGSML